MRGLTIVLLSFAAGAFAGSRLAHTGTTAANALVGRQRIAYAILTVVSVLGLIFYFAPGLWWVPSFAAIVGEQIVLDGSRVITAFALGLIVLLEWPGRRDPTQRRHLILGGGLLTLGTAFLTYRALPLRIDTPSRIVDAVVMQTTPFTCAPAAVATLVRWFGGDTTATERAIVAMTGTTREGTTTRAEIQLLRRLGFAPRYARLLPADSLAAIGRPAILHVNEPVASGVTIRHAVALLAVNREAQTVVIGNPLHGRQLKRFADLDGYWTGEAIFIEPKATARAP